MPIQPTTIVIQSGVRECVAHKTRIICQTKASAASAMKTPRDFLQIPDVLYRGAYNKIVFIIRHKAAPRYNKCTTRQPLQNCGRH